MTEPLTLLADSLNLLTRMADLFQAGALTPERFEAITTRVARHLEELREDLDDAPPQVSLPLCTMRFRGRFAVIDGGRP